MEKLELRNVCQHEHLVWRFAPGLVGIFGPNGSGKSNALNVAAYAALTNDYSRHPEGKAGMIRQQAGEDAPAYIRLEFAHDGHQVRLERGLQKPSRHRLQVDGREELRKATEIQAVIESSLGISRQLIDRYMFVGQDDLYAFLSDTPAVRAQSFAHLCGTTHAERCWEILGEFIASDSGLAAGEWATVVKDLRKKLAADKEKLRREEKTLAEAKDHRLAPKEKGELEAAAAALSRLEELRGGELDSLRSEEKSRFAKAREAKAEEKKALAAVEAAEAKLSSLERKAAEAEATLKTHAEQVRAWNRLLDAKRALAEAEEALEKVLQREPPRPELEGDAEALEEEKAQLNAELPRLRKTLAALARGDVTECPLCGTPVDNFRDHLEEMQRDEKRMAARLRQVVALLAEHETYRAAVAEWEDEKRKAEWEVERRRSVADSLQETPRPRKLDKASLRKMVEQRDELRTSVAAMRKEAQQASRRFAEARASHVAAKKAREEAEEELAQLEETTAAADWEQVQRQLEEDAKWAEVEAGASRGVALLSEAIEETRAELAEARKKAERQQKAAAWLEDLQKVRDEVMHRDRLPALVHRHALSSMEEVINDNLELFDSPFYVESDASLGFTARFPNGTRMPAVGLSGGQKVMLALSFRLAVSSLFASQVGMMILDEPTDGLDADNRRLAAEVFGRLGGIARSRGYQIVVITHDDLLASAFDQIFELAAGDG